MLKNIKNFSQKKSLKETKPIEAIEYKGSGIEGRGKINKAEKERKRIKGYKADVTKNTIVGIYRKLRG